MLILNNVLCFLFCRYNRSNVKSMKSALSYFYNADDIYSAKETLLSATAGLSINNLSKLSKHRNGEGRLLRELDDLFTIARPRLTKLRS